MSGSHHSKRDRPPSGGDKRSFVLGQEQQHVNIPSFSSEICLSFIKSVSSKISSTQMHKLEALCMLFPTAVNISYFCNATKLQPYHANAE